MTANNKLLETYRGVRKWETKTLDGYVPTYTLTNLAFHAAEYNRALKELEIIQQTVSGAAKTAIRKECRARGIKPPNFKTEGVSSIKGVEYELKRRKV